jgi:aminoglycoside 3-N-acetyltransferase
MTNRPVVTQPMLEAGLRALGLGLGDAIEVHSSLSAFGWVDGGAATIIGKRSTLSYISR